MQEPISHTPIIIWYTIKTLSQFRNPSLNQVDRVFFCLSSNPSKTAFFLMAILSIFLSVGRCLTCFIRLGRLLVFLLRRLWKRLELPL